MARKSRQRTLVIWVNGIRAAEWTLPPRGEHTLQYTADWTNAEEGRPLSLSLPLSLDNTPIKGAKVENYFDNLLPDTSQIRQRIRERYGTTSSSAFDLLVAIGRDCVGAVQLLPPDEEPHGLRQITATPLTDDQIEATLLQALSTDRLVDPSDEFRISIAGAQEKTALLWHEGRWCKPEGTTPTTHIFKLPLGLIGGVQADMSASVENEWLCSRIMGKYGIPMADCRIGQFGKQRTLIVERFDRVLHQDGYWLRLVQEDFCQALGLPSSQKYEGKNGPGMVEIARILQTSEQRDADLNVFLKAQILFWMLAAGDGHAKNFSIRILPRGRFSLTKLYDVLSYYPIMGHGKNKIPVQDVSLAMSVFGKNKHKKLNEIQRRHFNQTASRLGIGENAEGLINDVLEKTPSVLSDVQKELPDGFPPQVADSVLGGLEKAAAKLAGMPST